MLTRQLCRKAAAASEILRIFSGIQPSGGRIHVRNYFGAIRLQNSKNYQHTLIDLHAITYPQKENEKTMDTRTYSTDVQSSNPGSAAKQAETSPMPPPTTHNPSEALGQEHQPKELQQTSSGPKLDKLYKKIELEILGYEPRVMDSYQWFVLATAKNLNLTVGKVWAPHRSDKFRFPLLASVHIFKKHQVHYEVRTYHRFINIHKITGSTADTFLEYIQRNLPEGLGMKVTRVEVLPKPEFLEKSKPNE